MKISIFGGANPKPETKAYQEAYELGQHLGQSGFTIITGGYSGTMEAASRGANEAGGHVIGVTCDEIESYRPLGPNDWVIEEWRRETLRERIDAMVENCDAAVALPGGVGTLAEISMTWNLLIINAIAPKPLILIGDGWQSTIETLFRTLNDYIPIPSREFIAFAPNPRAAVELIDNFLNTQNQE
jgi:uncharacterized protein (TIGR00730 family)